MDAMDIARSATAMKQAETMSRVQMAVAKKMMDQDRMNGAAALKLLNAAQVGVAKPGDALIAAATGMGGAVDMYA